MSSVAYAAVPTVNLDDGWQPSLRLPSFDEPPKPPKIHACSVCCFFFSAFAVLFLAILGRAVETEYRYIKLDTKDPSGTSRDLYIAAGIYLGFCVISLGFWYRGLRRIRQYEAAVPGSPSYVLHTS